MWIFAVLLAHLHAVIIIVVPRADCGNCLTVVTLERGGSPLFTAKIFNPYD